MTMLGSLATWLNANAVFPGFPWWTYVLLAFVDTHVTTACVTLFLHRNQTHGAVTFSPVVEHAMRFWLWARTAMPTKEWVAVHRCHHANVDGPDDPHSPIVYGIWRVFFWGVGLYHTAKSDKAMIERYGKGTPDDLVERTLYTPLAVFGPVLTLVTNAWLFGVAGLGMWLLEMAWIPFFAAGVINGLGHWWGYRNFETPDRSTNLHGHVWSLLTCGEALHNNHHHIQNSPRFAMRRGELDPGYWYFTLLRKVGLARARDEGMRTAA